MSEWNEYLRKRASLEERHHEYFLNSETGFEDSILERELERIALEDEEKLSPMRLRSKMFSFLLENARVGADGFDPFPDRIGGRFLLANRRDRIKNEFMKKMPPRSRLGQKTIKSDLDLSHTSPDWVSILKLGFPGLRDRALDSLAKHDPADIEGCEFLRSVADVFEACRKCTVRFAAEARRQGAEIAGEVLEALSERAPKTLHEALELALLYHTFQEYSGILVRSEGVFQKLYIDFYRNDLAEKRLTRDTAKALLGFFFDKFNIQHFGANHNFCFGGTDPATGKDLNNELTDLALEVFYERKEPDPKLSLRIGPQTPDDLLDRAAECIKHGVNSIVFTNDETAYKMFRKQGKKENDLTDFIPIGCYEPAIMGREMCCSMSAYYNFAGLFDDLFRDRTAPKDMEEVLSRCIALQHDALSEALEGTRIAEGFWKEVNPSPVLSGTMTHCIEKARDVSNAGALYNSSGVMCAGIGTAADALSGIDYLVFETKKCTWAELADRIQNNWNDAEKLRAEVRLRAQKYGRLDGKADSYAVRLASEAAKQINAELNTRGGFFQMGCWSIDHSVMWGKTTSATPDGRHAGDPISKNLCATIGMDTKGITAMMGSALKFDHSEFPDGDVLDVMLHPSTVGGEDGGKIISRLIRTYFAGGGFFVHFNIADAETLKQARKEPEKYRNLQIRVCGWNAHFVDLSPEMQQCFIDEAEGKN